MEGKDRSEGWMEGMQPHLVGDGNAALPCVKDGQLVGLSVGVHDDLQEALVLLAAAV